MRVVSRASVVVAIALLTLIWLVLCRPWFLEGRTVPWDSKDQFYPWLYFVSRALHSGDSPCWNPYVYGGFPMCSDPQSTIFSPIVLGLMLAVDRPSFQALDRIELLHLLLGGVGTLVLGVRFRWAICAAMVAALVYMFGGSAVARMQHVPIILAYGYFPWALLSLDVALDRCSIKWAACFGVLAGIMAAHQNQVAFLFCLVLVGYLASSAALSGGVREFFVTRWRTVAMAVVTGGLTLAIPLYLTLQFLPFSNRPRIPYATAIAGSLDPLAFLTLFVGQFLGTRNPETYWSVQDPSLTYLYAGVLPMALVVGYGLPGGALLLREFRFFLVVGVLAVLYALGGRTPFYGLLYEFLPGVDLYRRPPDATFVLNVVLALSAGHVMDKLLTGTHPRVKWHWLFAELGALSMLLMWGLHRAGQQHRTAALGMEALVTLACFGIVFGLLYAIATSISRRFRLVLGFVAVVLLAVDLGLYNAGNRLNAVVRPVPDALVDGLTGKSAVAKFLQDGLDVSHRAGGPYRVELAWVESLWANAPMVFGIQSIYGYNPLRYASFEKAVGIWDDTSLPRPFGTLMTSYNAPLLNLLGVKYIASVKPLVELDPTVDADRFRLVFEEGVRIWENPDALPRVVAATRVYVETNLDRAIADGRMLRLDYRSSVVLDRLPSTLYGVASWPAAGAELPGHGSPRVTVRSYRNTEVKIDVASERDVILVLNDLYYPYWRVYVDGRERELLQANYLFRGVHVGPGERRVLFRFEPFSWVALKGTLARLHR